MKLGPTATEAPPNPDAHRQASARLRGSHLVAAQVACIVLTTLVLISFAVALPLSFEAARTPRAPGTPVVVDQLSVEDVRLLERWGLSLDFYATYRLAETVLLALAFIGAGALLFWRKADERMTLFVALWFVLLGATAGPQLDPLARVYPAWEPVVRFLQGATLGGFPIFTYLFPDGRFVPRWTRGLTFAWLAWIGHSPFTAYAVGDFAGPSALWFGVLVPGGMAIGIGAQVYRYLRVSDQVERQQTKWVIVGLLVVALGVFLYILVPVIAPAVLEPGLARVLYLNFSGTICFVIPFCLFLVCIAIAILRYRLWDVDRVINRTLVYGTLTGLLALVYVASVVLLQQLLHVLIGQESNQLVIVASTLAIAALFQPLRWRIQTTIDRHFYRRKYDVARTVQGFSATLRDEVDLNMLADDLLTVVNETMQPVHCSLWLRNVPPPRERRGKSVN